MPPTCKPAFWTRAGAVHSLRIAVRRRRLEVQTQVFDAAWLEIEAVDVLRVPRALEDVVFTRLQSYLRTRPS